MLRQFRKVPLLDLAIQGSARFGLPRDDAMKATLGFLDIMAMNVPEEDKYALLEAIPKGRKALEIAFDKRIIDGTASTSINLIQSTGLTVEVAIEFLAMLYDEIEKNSAQTGITDRLKAQLDGMLPPFF